MGIDLPRDIGTKRLPWLRLRRIIENLPETSATTRARRGQRPTIDTMFLRRIEHTLALLLWRDTADAKNDRNRPMPVPLVGDPKGKPGRDSTQVDELLARRLAKRQAELNRLEGR